MVQYKCNGCNKLFGLKGDWSRHINRKNPCNYNRINDKNDENDEIDNNDGILMVVSGNNQCLHCDKVFSFKHNLKRHMEKGCKKKDKKKDDDKYVLVCDELEKLKEEIANLKNNQTASNTVNNNTINNNTHNNTQNNTQNNTINNVTINMFGKENLSHLTVRDYKRVFKRCNLSVPEFILLKHFDENNPENNNIYISNLKSEYVTMYDGDKWIVADKDTAIQNLYDDNCGMLIEKFEDLKEQLDANTQSKFNRFIDRHDDQETIDNSKKEIRQVLYNNRHIPIKNKKNNYK